MKNNKPNKIMDAENSDTPITNSKEVLLEDGTGKMWSAVLSNFARKLERSLDACETHNKIQHEGLAQAAAKIESLYKQREELSRKNSELASALRKVVSWYDSKDSIDVLIDIEKEVKEALAAQTEETK